MDSQETPLPLDPPQPKKPATLSAKAESLNLLHYGTQAFAMTPAMVVQAAAQDIESYAFNLRVKAERREEKAKDDPHPKLIDPPLALAFMPKHVRGKTTAAEVIAQALADLAAGAGSREPNTARLYNAQELLREALALATHSDAAKTATLAALTDAILPAPVPD